MRLAKSKMTCELCGAGECSEYPLRLELSGALFARLVRKLWICSACITVLFFSDAKKEEPN